MITSTANPRITEVAKLRTRRVRDARGLFVIEGRRPLLRALAAEWPIVEVFAAPELLSDDMHVLVERVERAGISLTSVGPAAFAKMAYKSEPEGLLAVAERGRFALGSLPITDDGLYLVTEAVEKPGNLGAMLRTAEAAGVTAVVAADAGTDITNPNVVRASQGALFAVPTAAATALEVVSWLVANEIEAVAAAPSGGDVMWDADLTGRIAIVVGSEHAGLSPLWGDARAVTTPMRGGGDSLNAATSAALLLFEAVRQRS